MKCTMRLAVIIVSFYLPSKINATDTIKKENKKLTAPIADHTTNKSQFFVAFSKFIRIFLILLNNQKVQDNMSTIQSMLMSLLHTAMEALKVTASNPNQDSKNIVKKLLKSDPSLKRSMIEVLTKSATRFQPLAVYKKPKNNQPRPIQEADIDSQIVLHNFARIACHFINILQDPNNRENVTPNVIGMLEGIVRIGSQIIRTGTDNINSDEDQIKHFMDKMDPALIEQMNETISRSIKRAYSL